MLNLLAPLDDARFSQGAVHHALEALDARGVYAHREHHTPERILAWIDAEFGGTWSSEAAAGGIWIAEDSQGPVGFCAYDPRDLRFRWLRGWENEPAVGILGPLGVATRARTLGIGTVLLHAALFSLRERAYGRALLPAVAPELVTYYERHANARVVEEFETGDGRSYRTTILATGNGSNFQAVLDAARCGTLPLDVSALVVNNSAARVVQRGARAGIAVQLVAWDRARESRAEYDARILETVAATEPELVLLLGWMHVLSRPFVARFSEMLNLHPAFLPLDPAQDVVTMPDGSRMAAFRGPRAIDDACAAGAKWVGASVHRVGNEIDRGAVLARAPLELLVDEPRERLDERLHALERCVVAEAVKRWSYEQP